MQKSLSWWFILARWNWCEMPQQNAYKVKPSFRLQHAPSLARFPTKFTYLGYGLMPHDYLHTTMSLSCHKTTAFSMPFILAWVEVGNGSLIEPFLIVETTTTQVPSVTGARWNVMPTTPHTRPKVHGTRLVGSRSSTFILGFRRVVCKQVNTIFFKIL